jgi:hypothetical protein
MLVLLTATSRPRGGSRPSRITNLTLIKKQAGLRCPQSCRTVRRRNDRRLRLPVGQRLRCPLQLHKERQSSSLRCLGGWAISGLSLAERQALLGPLGGPKTPLNVRLPPKTRF